MIGLIILVIAVILFFRKKNIKTQTHKEETQKYREQSQEEIAIELEESRKMKKAKSINFGSEIAGLEFNELYRCSKSLKLNTIVQLVHEYNNPVDYFAVAIYYENYKLGYIPARECARIAVRLKTGVKFNSYIESYYQNNAFSSMRIRIIEVPSSI